MINYNQKKSPEKEKIALDMIEEGKSLKIVNQCGVVG
jgi:hypothetical protein